VAKKGLNRRAGPKNPPFVWGWNHPLPPAKLAPRCFLCHRFLIKDELVKKGPRKDGSTWFAHQQCLVNAAQKAELERKQVFQERLRERQRAKIEVFHAAPSERTKKISGSSGQRKTFDGYVNVSTHILCPACGYANGRHAKLCERAT
jgi:hypothetical protein